MTLTFVIYRKWCNRLAGAKVNSPERQRLIDDYSATADDVLILQKEVIMKGFINIIIDINSVQQTVILSK